MAHLFPPVAQAGGAHLPLVHTCEPQSVLAPHTLPSGHLPGPVAQPGGAHVQPVGVHVHTLDPQSPGPPQLLPSAHLPG